MTSIKYDHLHVMGTITGKFYQNPLKTVGGVVETRLTVEKLPKDRNSIKNQSSMTSIKYDHLHVMGTITGKFHQNPLKTVGGVVETRYCLRTDGRTDETIKLTKGHSSKKSSQALPRYNMILFRSWQQ